MGNVFSFFYYDGQDESRPSDFTLPAHQEIDGTESITKTDTSNHEVDATDCKKNSETPNCNSVNTAVEQVKKGLHSVKVRTHIQTHTLSLYI